MQHDLRVILVKSDGRSVERYSWRERLDAAFAVITGAIPNVSSYGDRDALDAPTGGVKTSTSWRRSRFAFSRSLVVSHPFQCATQRFLLGPETTAPS
jgi:hypothetical protein